MINTIPRTALSVSALHDAMRADLAAGHGTSGPAAAQVDVIQTALCALRFMSPVNLDLGHYGPRTVAGVHAAQRDFGLTPVPDGWLRAREITELLLRVGKAARYRIEA